MSPRAVRSIKAMDFMDTFGANVHFGDNNYRNLQAIADRAEHSGLFACSLAVPHPIRWGGMAGTRGEVGGLSSRQGLKADVLVIGYRNAQEIPFTRQQPLIGRIADIVESLEGPNEINNRVVGDGTHGPFDTTDQTEKLGVELRRLGESDRRVEAGDTRLSPCPRLCAEYRERRPRRLRPPTGRVAVRDGGKPALLCRKRAAAVELRRR